MKTLLIGIIIGIFITSSVFAQNVGIGAPNPTEKLEVGGAIKFGYTNSAFNAGALRYNDSKSEMEFNTGFVWRTLVNTFKDSSMSSITPFTTTTRNSSLAIPGAKLTIDEAGTYLIIYKVNGSNNNVYFPAGGNFDISGTADFLLNGGTIARRNFVVPENTYNGSAERRDFQPFPTEYSTIQNLSAGNVLTITARMDAFGTVTGGWTINEARITTIRLY